ncbi:hypothetical protein [Heyndrickxia acidiproducens]|uniref:hypothetical protein n=1 Tax=Heyndrickxia acidiproducens TaxID=1121084 RepID=UPI000378A6A9|nr:hypothetical protein [Heyndrickxia acidiproducens]
MKKNQLGEILRLKEKEKASLKKPELFTRVIAAIDDKELPFIYIKYAQDLALHPAAVEKMLGISKTERLRRTKEGKLAVECYASFYKWGKTLEYPLYEGYSIRLITQAEINEWRKQHQLKIEEKRKLAAKKSIVTKKKNEQMRKHFYKEEWRKMLSDWFRIDGQLGAALQLCFWTMWASRWAKECQVKARRARTKVHAYEAKKEMFYQMKNQSLRRLIRTPFAILSFYRPDQPDKIVHLNFCTRHFELWMNEKEFDYVTKRDFYEENKTAILKCPQCHVERIKDYYSLYYLTVGHESLQNGHFSFHTPYPVGTAFFPGKETLPRVKHEEGEGLFRFGRTLAEEEKIIFNEKEVIKYFQEATLKFDLYFPDK